MAALAQAGTFSVFPLSSIKVADEYLSLCSMPESCVAFQPDSLSISTCWHPPKARVPLPATTGHTHCALCTFTPVIMTIAPHTHLPYMLPALIPHTTHSVHSLHIAYTHIHLPCTPYTHLPHFPLHTHFLSPFTQKSQCSV